MRHEVLAQMQAQMQTLAEAFAAVLGVPTEEALGEREMLQALPVMLRRSGILLFAGDAALQDLRHRSIAAKTFAIFGLWGFAAAVFQMAMEGSSMKFLFSLHSLVSIFSPFLPGILLLILSKILRGAVGNGDALYFLTAAWFLPMGKLVWVLCAGFCFSAAAGLCLILKNCLLGRRQRNIKNCPLPFAAIVFPAVCAALLL